jgi:UDP-glucose 4-epimerase
MITGASGFIGSHFCRFLANQDVEIHAISRTSRISQSSSMYWWQGDLQDISKVRKIIQSVKPDVVYHLASNVTGARSVDYVLPTLYSNFLSTVNLLIAVAEVGCSRIILAGSLEEPEPDQIPVIPSSPYAAAKWSSSAYAHMFHELYQTPVVLARLFMVYGPDQHPRFLIPYVISSLLDGFSPKLSSGTRPVDWIYIDDVVSGLIAMAHVSGIEGCTIDLGSGTLVTIRELVHKLVSLVNYQIQPLFGAIPDRPLEQVRVANAATSYTQLGWRPETTLDEGLKRTVEWYRKRRETILDCQDMSHVD